MLLHLFFSGFALSLSLCLDLGTVNVAIVREGVSRGFWPSFLVGVGSSFGDLTYAVLATTGVALLLGVPAVRWMLWIGGSVVAKSPVQGAIALAVFLSGFFTASIVWSFGMALLSATSGRKLGPTFVRGISVLSAILFLYFAVDVFLDGYRSFVVPQ